MQKLVVSYTISDGYTYSSNIVEAISYESAEAAYVHLYEAIKTTISESEGYLKYAEFDFSGKTFELNAFIELLPVDHKVKGMKDIHENKSGREYLIVMPTIQTLEEWHNDNLND